METLHVATSEARAGLLADIVGHPTMATIQELDYLNPSMSDDLIRRHLDRLEDAGVIAKHELESGERRRDFPLPVPHGDKSRTGAVRPQRPVPGQRLAATVADRRKDGADPRDRIDAAARD
jgi:DNA-binding transcriptional ArsR family regulator